MLISNLEIIVGDRVKYTYKRYLCSCKVEERTMELDVTDENCLEMISNMALSKSFVKLEKVNSK